ncbi:hypothetical protein SAMN05192584_11520 [Streptomyces pini]|uniref:Uncharacterized protein n=1 Tax=Streptomyces pini TaxID=1520580 RepID=A0A1I4FZM7_9ACTN|nr:hypothetical protein SAMN05192584_11520 [Streptomyces pini]
MPAWQESSLRLRFFLAYAIITGNTTPLAAHSDVNAIDLTGADTELAKELETAAADNLKRVLRPADATSDWSADPGTRRMLSFVETKTVWHPVGV